MDHVDGFLFEGLHLLVAEDGSVETDAGKPFLQLVDGKFWVNNHAHVLRCATDDDTRYLFYALSTIPIRPFMSGSVQAKLSQGNLNRIPVPYPTAARDRARIARSLGALDDKIELNRRMSQTLDSMARALFKSWFVDFEPVRAKSEGRDAGIPIDLADLFPDSFEDTELGKVPSGWEIEVIENIAERVAMGPFGSSIKVDTFVPDGIPVISGQHLRGVLLSDGDFNFVTIEHADKLRRSNVQRGDVVFTHAGSIGQVAYIPETARFDRYIISQRQFYMRCDIGRVSPLYVVSYFQSPEGRRRLLANTSSTGVPSISQPVSYLKQLRLALPPQPLMNAFDSVARSLYSRTAAHTQQCLVLEDLRNELLPRLVAVSPAIRDWRGVKQGADELESGRASISSEGRPQ
jgi:type I restriction enzyme S subunit